MKRKLPNRLKKKHLAKHRTDFRSLSYRDIDEDHALIDVVVSTGSPVYREDYDSSGNLIPFYRSLEISEDAIRMDRLLSGAPVLDNHDDGQSVTKTLGSVEKAWIEEDRLMATLKISKISREDKEVARKIKSGIITGVSVGAEIHSQKNVTSEKDDIIKVIADDWEPYEVSLVMIPADRESIIRSNNNFGESRMKNQTGLSESDLEKIISRVSRAMGKEEKAMDEEEEEKDETPSESESEDKAMDEEKNLGTSEVLMDVADEVAGAAVDALPDSVPEEVMNEVEMAVEEAVEEVVSEEETPMVDELAKLIRKQLIKKGYGKKISPKIQRRKSMKISHDPHHEKKAILEFRGKAEDALAGKISRGMYKVDSDNKMKTMSMVQLGRSLLHRSGYQNAIDMSSSDVYNHLIGGRHERRNSAGGPIAVSSDFANLLTNAMTKSVMASYEEMRGKQSFDPFVTRQTVENFKDQERVQLGERADLKEVAPGADAEIAAMSDRKETYKVKTYSTIFQLTRQGFIDDDTGELQKVLASGKAAADLESDLVYQQITGGTVGGQGLFVSSNRNSVSGANAALGHESYTGIKAIFKGLATQTGLDSSSPLHLTFGYLLVPVELNFAANQSKQVQYPAVISSPNPYADMYTIISEPRLDQNSTSTYYGLASEAGPAHPFLELGTISGAPIMKYEESFSNDVLKWKLTHDVGAKVLDYRLIYRVQGA